MNLSFFVLLLVILLQTWSGDTLGSKEKNTAKATLSSSASSTLDKKTDKSTEKETIKTASKDKAKPPCEDDDNDGICNEDEVDEPVAKSSSDQAKSSKTTTATPSPTQKATPSCPDDDNDGICNDDEIDEVEETTTKPPSTKEKQTSKQDTSKVDKSKSIPSKDNKATPTASGKKSNVKSVPEKEQKVKKIVENLDEDDDDDGDDEDEEEEEEIVTVAVKKSQESKGKAAKGGTSNVKSSSQKEKKTPEKSGVKKKPEKAPVEDEDDEDDGEDDDEDDEPVVKNKKQVAATKKNTKQSQQKEKEKEKEDKKKSKSKKTSKRDSDEDDDEDEDEDEKVSSKKTDTKSEKPSKTSSSPSKTESKAKSSPEVSKSSSTASTTQQESNQTELSGKSHVDEILKLRKIGSKEDKSEQNLIMSLLKDLKKIYENSIKPLEQLYKYRGISSRLLSDAEIFSKPLVLLLGPKGSGKTSIVNYLLGLQNTPWQLNTGLSTSYPHFTLILHGDTFTKLSPTEVAADFTFSGLQKFGQHFMEHHIQAFKMPLDILQRMTFVDCPGFMDGMSGIIAKEPGKAIDTEVYQWLVDRSDVIYIVIDVNQLHLTSNLQSLYEQLRGREIRFLLNKADTVSHSEIVTVIGKLLWMLSPLMTGDTPPKVYALTTQMESYEPFLDEQEQEWLNDLSRQVSGLARVESHIAEVRRHAVRVRNHAKLVDCYLATYYIHKPLFIWGANSRKFAAEITENPDKYRVFSGALTTSLAQNVSRYDLPDPEIYKEFFRTTSLVDFKPLSATCSFFRGCPIDKLDVAIAYQLPDLVSKYKKLTKNKQQ
ncbi:sarcalumenin-like isoform X2 [Brevipalpus obovatus]|uniref:sarcalumenin-like isoform X2 n=1 Tax=Brevipalpus obovatus TaxID=246614 RepID=UPI003D9FAD10